MIQLDTDPMRAAWQEHERDLAHEADMRELRKQQLRDDISLEDANEELQDWLDDRCNWDCPDD